MTNGAEGNWPKTACALVASIGNAHDFKNGSQPAAWLGLTPSHTAMEETQG